MTILVVHQKMECIFHPTLRVMTVSALAAVMSTANASMVPASSLTAGQIECGMWIWRNAQNCGKSLTVK